MSEVFVQQRLKQVIQEFKDGRREGSIVSTQTIESINMEDKETWRTIRKELEEIGISVAAFDANKGFIMSWFKEAIESGAFEEQMIHGNVDKRPVCIFTVVTFIINTHHVLARDLWLIPSRKPVTAAVLLQQGLQITSLLNWRTKK
jgi:hypothetical protein